MRMVLVFLRPPQPQEGATLHPQEPHPNQNDQRIAHHLDDAHGVAHHLGGGAQEHRGDADQRHGGDRLQDGRGEGQHHTALPGLVIGDEVRRDHRLAMAGSGSVEDAVEERQAHQSIGRGAVGLGRADEPGELAIELCLLGEDPAGETADLDRRRAAAGAERLRQRGVKRRSDQEDDNKRQRNARPRRISCRTGHRELPLAAPRSVSTHQGQCTRILLENCAPQAMLRFGWSAGISLSFLPSS